MEEEKGDPGLHSSETDTESKRRHDDHNVPGSNLSVKSECREPTARLSSLARQDGRENINSDIVQSNNIVDRVVTEGKNDNCKGLSEFDSSSIRIKTEPSIESASQSVQFGNDYFGERFSRFSNLPQVESEADRIGCEVKVEMEDDEYDLLFHGDSSNGTQSEVQNGAAVSLCPTSSASNNYRRRLRTEKEAKDSSSRSKAFDPRTSKDGDPDREMTDGGHNEMIEGEEQDEENDLPLAFVDTANEGSTGFDSGIQGCPKSSSMPAVDSHGKSMEESGNHSDLNKALNLSASKSGGAKRGRKKGSKNGQQSNKQCHVCQKIFTLAGDLKRHLLIHTGIKCHQCTVCDKAFTHDSYLKRHLLTHSTDKPHECSVCGMTFTHPSNLKSHMFTHTGYKPYKCSECGKSFLKMSDLKRHMLIHSGDKPYQCMFCDKAFNRKENLRSHSLVHTGDKPFICGICEKTFSHVGNLKTHILTHTAGDNPHKCTLCEKSFTQISDLNRHYLIHTGDKPYKCSVCGKAFNRSSILKEHMMIHSGDRPHKCTICDKDFNRRENLKKHLLVHKGDKPHKCDVCDKAFIVRKSLETHLLLHTGERPFKCTECGKGFVGNRGLKAHLLIHFPRPKTQKLKNAESDRSNNEILLSTSQFVEHC